MRSAVEYEELLKNPVHRPVRDEGWPDSLDNLPDARIGVPAFEEREPVGVEQGTVALRQGDRAPGAVSTCSVVDETEQDEELCPRAEPLIHGVRMQGGVFAETLVEAGERVVAEEGVVLRQHAALLGVEQEDEAEDDSEEAAVDIVAVAGLGERFAQQIAAGGIMGGLESPDELVEGVHHLLGEALADLVLVLAAVLEEGGEPLGARQREEALLGEEEAEGGAEGASGGEAHVRDAEVHPAGAFAPRGGDEAECDAVEEQAGGNPGAPEQALGTALGRGFEARTGTAGYWPVEVLSGVEHLHEELPRTAHRRAGRARGRRSRGGGSRRSPGEATSSSAGTGASSVPAYPRGEKPQSRTVAANSRKSAMHGSGPRAGSKLALSDASKRAGSAPPRLAGSGSPPPSRAQGRRPPSRSAG